MVVRSRLVVVPLFEKMKLSTGGVMFASPVLLDIANDQFSGLVPYCEQITLVTLTEFASANFQWDVQFASGYTRQSELSGGPESLTATACVFGAGTSAVSSVRHTPYSTVSKFLLESRLILAYGDKAGSSGDLFGTLSATLLMQTVGM